MYLINEINTRGYVSILKKMTEEGQQVSMAVIGSSMEPFLRDRQDAIKFQKPTRELHPGDMVFYQRMHGQYVMHRICKKNHAGYFMAGDHQSSLEGPIKEKQIFAVITEVRKNGKWITARNLKWKFYATIWRHLLPIRGLLLRAGGMLNRMRKKIR